MRQTEAIGQKGWRAAVAAVLFLTLACGGGAVGAGSTISSTPSSESMMHHATLDVKDSRFGQIIVDGDGRALYLFTADKTSESTCYDACAKAWPPFLGDKTTSPAAMHAVNAALIGTTTRKDAAIQVTYGGHPLYYYEGEKAGEVKCQGVVNFGGTWYVVDETGKAITKT